MNEPAPISFAGCIDDLSRRQTSEVLTIPCHRRRDDDQIQVKSHTHQADLWKAQIKTRGLSDVYVFDNKFAPGATTGWHSHPGPSMILVVAGTVTNYMGDDQACTGHVYAAGAGFIDPGGADVHMLRNETNAPAETIAMQLLPNGADRRIDAPAPKNCPS